MNTYFASHTLVIPHGKNRMLIYQCVLRKGIITDMDSLSALCRYVAGAGTESSRKVRFRDLTCFSLSGCLLDNPAGIRPDESHELVESSLAEFVTVLEAHDLLVGSDVYLDKFGKKDGLFDRHHIGNFHQQIGAHLMRRRDDTEEWWIYQKFEADLAGIKDNPYRWVQNHFLKSFFKDNLSRQEWLDFGCGIGYYSHFFSRRNANVLGVDPSQAYIDIAKERFSNNGRVEYLTGRFESESDFRLLGQRSFDRIYLSDVFLYYFEQYKPMDLSASGLLRQLKKRLNRDGRIFIMDPHGCFHLQAWMGGEVPFLISTEYANRRFRVTPTLEQVSRAAESAGLCITKIRELRYHGQDGLDSQAKRTIKEFPVWWLFELAAV